MWKIINVLVLFAALLNSCENANILGLFPHPGKSHFDVFQVLMEALANRGHNVTVVSFFPLGKPLPGYHDISLVGLQPIILEFLNFDSFETSMVAWLKPYWEFYRILQMGLKNCDVILPSQQIQDLLQSKQLFDLIIIEQFNTDCFLSIAHKLKAPFMAISSCAALPWLNARYGSPAHPAYVPNLFLGVTDRMSLLERLQNVILNWVTTNLHYPLYDRPAQKLVQRYIGEAPPLQEIGKNTSLLLLNTHFTLHQSKPLAPGVIEVGGMHIKEAQPLSKDLESFLVGATDGVIVFSLGSILNAATLPQTKIDAFLRAFRTLPQRVVWKINRNLTSLPSNILTLPWLPQRDILAHHNVRAFIAHGGLLGLTEAVYNGVPIVAIPMFGDQSLNVKAAVQAGIAVELAYNEISEETVLQALTTVLTPRFKKRTAKFSKLFLDRPNSPLDLAIYWTEYLLRHDGRGPSKPAAVNLTFFQYYLMDVTIVLLVLIFSTRYIIMKSVHTFHDYVCQLLSKEKDKLE